MANKKITIVLLFILFIFYVINFAPNNEQKIETHQSFERRCFSLQELRVVDDKQEAVSYFVDILIFQDNRVEALLWYFVNKSIVSSGEFLAILDPSSEKINAVYTIRTSDSVYRENRVFRFLDKGISIEYDDFIIPSVSCKRYYVELTSMLNNK